MTVGATWLVCIIISTLALCWTHDVPLRGKYIFNTVWKYQTTKSQTSACKVTKGNPLPIALSERSSTYSLDVTRRPHLRLIRCIILCNKTLSSVVAKPEPAVMPRVALIKRENTLSTPNARSSLYAASESLRMTGL